MAVTTEPPWVNRNSGVSARNGTTTHTITLGFTPTTGNFLMMVVGGAVTHTNGTWTEQVAPVNFGELSVFTKTSNGTETTFVDTANGSNYPVVWAAYEFPAGTVWGSSSSDNRTTDTFPQLSGLPGTERVIFAASGLVHDNSGDNAGWTSRTSTWTAPWVKDFDVFEAQDGVTDGYGMAIGHQINVTATAITPTASFGYGVAPLGTADHQAITWAINAAALSASISAGDDAHVQVNTLFSRTATETGLSGVTAREWTIQAGPTGVGNTLATAAALSWTPTVLGVYTLRYSVTHSGGTTTDDATVTVIELDSLRLPIQPIQVR